MPEKNKVTVIDCQIAGIAGDMFLGALIDLGADVDEIISAIKTLENKAYGYENVKITVEKVMRKGFSAALIDVVAEEKPRRQARELIELVVETSKNLKLSEKAQKFASNVAHTLVEAEAKLHEKDFAYAHLHEVGLVDTPAEIIGAAVALDNLGLFDSKFYATPVSVGGGLFKFSHGTVSSPAPATLEILQNRGFAFRGGPVEAELATPTGAAILVNLAEEVSAFYPMMVPLRSGYGAGIKDFADMPNVLRITIGNSVIEEFSRDDVSVLETNLDDITGEVVGYAVERLLHEGAKDVCVVPMFTKKNRPGQILKVIVDKRDIERLVRVLVEETGTLGVRVYSCERRVVNRETLTMELIIDGIVEQVKVKVSKDRQGEIVRVKPEFEDAKRLAEKKGKPLREIIEIITTHALDVLAKK
jgi:uncharacterized protein (TIGR00299 family) protein